MFEKVLYLLSGQFLFTNKVMLKGKFLNQLRHSSKNKKLESFLFYIDGKIDFDFQFLIFLACSVLLKLNGISSVQAM